MKQYNHIFTFILILLFCIDSTKSDLNCYYSYWLVVNQAFFFWFLFCIFYLCFVFWKYSINIINLITYKYLHRENNDRGLEERSFNDVNGGLCLTVDLYIYKKKRRKTQYKIKVITYNLCKCKKMENTFNKKIIIIENI